MKAQRKEGFWKTLVRILRGSPTPQPVPRTISAKRTQPIPAPVAQPEPEPRRVRDKDHQLTGEEIRDLWARGRLYEIFVPEGRPTLNTVARVRDVLVHRFDGDGEVEQIVNGANEIISAPLYREQWERGRKVMTKVKLIVGWRAFDAKESKVWGELWTEVERDYHLKPDMITDQVIDRLASRYVTRAR